MKNIHNDLKNNNLKPIYLISGDEEYFILKIKLEFIKYFGGSDSYNFNIYDKDNFDKNDFLQELYKTSFFVEKKLIILYKLNLFVDTNFEKLFDKNAADVFINAVKENLENNVILIIEDKIDKKKKLYKFIEESGYACEISSLDRDEIEKFVLKILKKNEKQITRSNLDLFLDSTNNNLFEIKNELDKIIDYTAEKEVIEKESIEALMNKKLENVIFELTNSIQKRDTKNTLKIFSELRENNISETLMLATIRNNYRDLLIVKDMIENGKTIDEISNATGFNQKRIAVVKSKANSYDKNYLIQSLKTIYKYNVSILKGELDIKDAIIMLIT